MLVVADRLKKSLSEIASMPVEEYNTWIAYLVLESEQQEEAMRKTRHR